MSQNQITTVDFHGQAIIAATIDGKPFVPMKPICDNIGLAWNAQFERIKRHPVMNTCIRMTRIQMPGDDQSREVVCLPLGMLNGWLFGVDVNRVKADLREKLMDYQRECFDVLFQHFMPRMEAAMQASANDYTRINPAQAQALSELVIAETKRTGKHYKTVWGSFNRHFRVNSYHELPAARFDEACQWLGGKRMAAKPESATSYELPAVDFDFRKELTTGQSEPKPLSSAVMALVQQISWKLAAEAQVSILQFLERFIAYRTTDATRNNVSHITRLLEPLTLNHVLAHRYFSEIGRVQHMADVVEQMAIACTQGIRRRMGTIYA
jgi:hypothetical protein